MPKRQVDVDACQKGTAPCHWQFAFNHIVARAGHSVVQAVVRRSDYEGGLYRRRTSEGVACAVDL
jgi:hypothetical protein